MSLRISFGSCKSTVNVKGTDCKTLYLTFWKHYQVLVAFYITKAFLVSLCLKTFETVHFYKIIMNVELGNRYV